MAGIYIHIPFCKKACHYCDFHFSTSLKYMDEMVEAICREMVLKKGRLEGPVQSVYFGGGTPSILSAQAFYKIFDTLYRNFVINDTAEITVEANPDDLNIHQLKLFNSLPVNRLSIGVQSFFEEDLKWMNRAHSATEAESSIKRAQDVGLENLTIDLIYGFPLLSDNKWNYNLEKAIELATPHISAYAMTVEPRTALAHAIHVGKQTQMDEQQSAIQFKRMVNVLGNSGYEQYEISNFAAKQMYAIHNTNYWKGIPFLGIGPSAHGFDGSNRQYNIANNAAYMQKLSNNELAETVESLSLEDQFNEQIMTGLRTIWGVNLANLREKFGKKVLSLVEEEIQKNTLKGNVLIKDDNLILTENGKLYADRVASDLFLMEGDLERL